MGRRRFNFPFRETINGQTSMWTIAPPAFPKGWSMDTCPLPTPTFAPETIWTAMTVAGRASTAGGATSLDSSVAAKTAEGERHRKLEGAFRMNPGVKADQGVDKSAHDFLQSWVVAKQPNKSVAYFSRRSYPCLEATVGKSRHPVPQGMVRLQTHDGGMQKFSDSLGTVNTVGEAFRHRRQVVANAERGKERVRFGISAGKRACRHGPRRGMCRYSGRRPQALKTNTLRLHFAESKETAAAKLCRCFGLRREVTGRLPLSVLKKMAGTRGASSPRQLLPTPGPQWKRRRASPVILPP